MPNYCDNSVTIVGDHRQVEELRERMTRQGEHGFHFDVVWPEPEQVTGSDQRIEWRNQNWGDKFDGSYEYKELEFTPGTWKLRFTSAWDPPLPVYRRLCEQYHAIRIEFFAEDGQADWIGQGWAEWRDRSGECEPGVVLDYDRLMRSIQERSDGALWFGNDQGDEFWLTLGDVAFIRQTSWSELEIGQSVTSGSPTGLTSVRRWRRGWKLEFARAAAIHVSPIQFQLLLTSFQ